MGAFFNQLRVNCTKFTSVVAARPYPPPLLATPLVRLFAMSNAVTNLRSSLLTAPAPTSPSTPAISSTGKAVLVAGAVVAAGLAAWYFLSQSSDSAAAPSAKPAAADEEDVPIVKSSEPKGLSTPYPKAVKPDSSEDESDSEEEGSDGEAAVAAPTGATGGAGGDELTTRADVLSKKDLLNMLGEMHTKVAELQVRPPRRLPPQGTVCAGPDLYYFCPAFFCVVGHAEDAA